MKFDLVDEKEKTIIKQDFIKFIESRGLQASIKRRKKYPNIRDPHFEMILMKDRELKHNNEFKKKNLFHKENRCIFEKKSRIADNTAKVFEKFSKDFDKFLLKYEKTNFI